MEGSRVLGLDRGLARGPEEVVPGSVPGDGTPREFLLPGLRHREVHRRSQEARREKKSRRRYREMVKVGMISSVTVCVLTGFRIVRPFNPLHTVSGVTFLALALLHTLQNDR